MHASELIEYFQNSENNSFEDNANFDQKIDEFFQIKFQKIRSNNAEHYPDLGNTALSTSYCDYYKILSDLPKGAKLLDIGAGYCRGTLLSTFLNLSQCQSIEITNYRYEQALESLKRINGDTNLLMNEDLSLIQLPKAQAYYLYFAKNHLFYHLLSQILEYSKEEEQILYICESHGDMIDFMKSLKNSVKVLNKFKCSVKRHDPYIYKFSIKSSSVQVGVNESLSQWFMQNFQKDSCLEMEYFHQILKKNVSLLLNLNDLDIVYYEDKFQLQNLHSNRIYDLDNEFKFIKLWKMSELGENVQNALKINDYKKDRILLAPNPIVENAFGQREYL